MDSKTPIDRTIDAMYAAALDPAGWQQALRMTSDCLGSTAACLFLMDNAAQRVSYWVSLRLNAGEREYREHYVVIDPRRRFAAEHPEIRIHYDYMLMDERGMDRDEFYNWQARTDQLRYFLGCRVHADRNHAGFAAFHWPRRCGHVEKSHIRLFKRITPHFERALQLSVRLGTLRQHEIATQTVFDELGHALVLLDSAGRVVFVNRAAKAIIAEADGLVLTARGLVAQDARDQAVLQRLIAAAATTPPGAGGVQTVSRFSGRRPYAALVSPLPNESVPFALGAPAVAVFVTDPERHQEMPETLLMRLYGLTRAEAAVAVRVAAGMVIKQAAGDLKISANTARLHLQRVMDKTGAHRQSELVRLLLTSMPPRL